MSAGGNTVFGIARFNSNGTLDLSFSSDGLHTTTFGNSQNIAHDVVIDGNGKIVVAGYTLDPVTSYDFAVARYLDDGTLDASFDGNGLLTTDFSSTNDFTYDIAIDAQGRIVVGGSSAGDFALARYLSNGTLDTNFGAGGKVTTSGDVSEIAGLAIDGDGNIVAAGVSHNGSDFDFAVVRYLGGPSLSISDASVTENNGITSITTTLLSDNFNTENGGVTVFDYAGFANWDVSGDGVDLHGAGGFDPYPGNGLYVDLSYFFGSRLESQNTFTLTPGQYQLTFNLGNNPNVVAPNTATVSLGSVYSESFTRQGSIPLETITRTINVTTATSGKLAFDATGDTDSGNLIIDNVQLTKVESLLTFTVTLDSATSSGFTVAYSTQDGTATTADSDYVANTTGLLTLAGTAGETQTIQVTVNGDTTFEPDEIMSVVLGTITGNNQVTILDGTGEGTILNDDSVFQIDLVSSDAAGGLANSASFLTLEQSAARTVSADGRYVVFESGASDLVPGDTNGQNDIFRKDTLTGAITLVSTANDGTQGNSTSNQPTISADGRYVAFQSMATNLTANATGGNFNVFVKDLQTGTLTLASANSLGEEGNFSSRNSAISDDGRYVAFDSLATNLVAGATNGTYRVVFRKDLQTGAIVLASSSSADVAANSNTVSPVMSGDGRYVAFYSAATNLVTGDTNSDDDVFVKDLQTGVTTRVSTDSSGNEATGGNSQFPSISSDGRYVAFSSIATDLVTGDTNGNSDVFVKDLQTGITTRISTDSGNLQGDSGSLGPSISTDGQFVAFYSSATNLVTGDTNAVTDVFVKNLQTGEIIRVSTDDNGNQGDGSSQATSLNADGSVVVFHSLATNLVLNDTNGFTDVFRVTVGAVSASATSVSVDLGATTSVTEGSASQLTYTLTRTGDTTSALTVNVTFGGAASLGSDYSQSGATNVVGNNAEVTFLAGSSTAVVTVTGSDDLTDEVTEAVTLTVATGSGYDVGAPANASGDITDNDGTTSASFTIPDDGTVRAVLNGTTLEIRSVPGDVVLASRDITTLTDGITFASGSEDETLIVDASAGDPIPAGGLNFDADGGTDRLVLIGDGTQDPDYQPNGTTNGDGSVGTTDGTINFTGVDAADFDTVGTFTLVTPNADDVVDLANGTLGSGADATSITGTSGGVGFPQANVRNSGIAIDTTSVAGTDSVTVTSASNTHGNTSLNVMGGTEAGDVITIDGTTTFSGTTTLDAKTVNLNADVTNAVAGTTATQVNVTAPGQIQDGIDAAATNGTVHIATGSYSGNVSTAMKSVTLDPDGAVASTGDWTLDSNDTLNIAINGTTAGTDFDQLNIDGNVSFGGATLNLSGTHVPAPADTFAIINATGTVTGTLSPSTVYLNNKPLEATYVGGPPGSVTLGYDSTPSIDGGAGADDFEVSLDSSGNIIIKRNGVEVLNTPLAGLTELTINATDDDDSLLLDLTNGNPIPTGGLTFNGGGGDDEMSVKGTDAEVVVYTPDAALFGNGSIDIDGKIVNFTGLEPVDFDNVMSFTLNLPNGDDIVDITNGFNSALTTALEAAGTVPAIVFTGTSGGIAFESAHVFRTTNVTVDTTLNTDGTDAITVISADNAHLNTNLSIITGTGGDAVSFVGAISVTGTVTISTDGAVTDDATDGVADITAATLSITAGSIGSSGNDIDTSVDSLTTDTSASNGDQFLNEANGLTAMNLNAGSGDITLAAGAITDTDVDVDFAADAVTVTATSFGASGNNIDTSVNSLSIDTSSSGGDQFIHESTGLTDLNLNAGTGDITLVDEGQISDTSVDGIDITADSFSLTITTSGEFGAGGNRIETDVTSLSATTLGQDRNVYIHEANSLTNTNITISPADIHLSAGGDINTGTGILTGNAANLISGGNINVDTTVSQLNFSTTANGNITVNETNNLGQLNIDAGSGDVSITAGGAITDGDGTLDIAADEVSLIATSLGATGLPLQLNANTLTTDTDDVTDGDQYLAEANTLTVGTADLNAGSATLYLVSGAFLTASGGDILNNVVVENGATLGGSGAVTGITQVNAGGTVAPGATTGILNTIDVVFASGSNFSVEVDGNVAGTSYDQLNVTGTVDLGGTTLVTTGLVTSTPGQQIVLINNDGTDAIVGTFNGLTEGATVTINGVDFFLSYVSGTNSNDVTLTEAGPANYTSDGVGAGALELRLNAGNVQFVDDGVVVDSRPLASLVNQLITIDGSDPANETLLVNFAFGGFFDVDVLFNGGIGPGGNDKLVVDGGTFTTVEHTFTTVLPAEHSGNIEYDTGAAVVTISYTGLEPVDMTGSTITDLIFNLPVGSANDFRLEDDGNLTNGLNRIVSNGGTFETTLFVNPTGSLTINAGGLGDYFNLYQLDDGYYTLGAPITFNGGAGADRMYVHTTATTTTIPTGGVNFVGSGNNDGFVIYPGYVATTIAHSFTNSNDGSVNIDGSTIDYDDMNVAVGIYDQLTATNRTFQFAAGSDTISFGDDPTANDNFSRISGTGSVTTDFKNPSATFALNGGDGDDAITIGSFAGMDAQFVAAVTIDGEGNTDSITQNAALTLGSGTSTGNLSLTAETIDLNAAINTTAGTADTVTLSGTDISINAAITADGSVSATAINNIDLTSGSITTTSDASVLAGNTLTTDATGTDITAVNASLAGAGGIGSLTNPIRLSVTTLVTDSNDLSDGDQFLAEADTLDIGATDLDAGTATITLVSGTFLTTATGSILSPTVVENGATLGGNGTVTGSVTAQSGGTVSPGPTTAVLNTGSATFTSGANFNVEVNGNVAGTGYDQLNVTGTVNLGGATLNATGTIPSLTGQTIVIVNNDGVDPVTGTFAGLAEGDTVFISGIGFKLSYAGGTGNDVTLTQLIQVSVTVSPLGVAEDGTQRLVYTFHRNGILDAMVVNFGISGTALAGQDFSEPSSRVLPGATTGTFRFGYGDNNYVMTVIPTADVFVEADETLILTVLPGANYVPSIPNTATGTIVNDDSVQEVSVSVSPASTTEDGSGKLVYTFTRTGGSALQKSKPLTVDFSVGGGANDATFNTDYTVVGAKTFGAASGTVIFGAKNPTAVVTVDPTPDQVAEPNETVVLTLSASPNYNVVMPNSASGLILDDDTAATVTLSIDTATIAEAAGVATVTATLSSVRSQPVTVTLGLTGTATGAGTDYNASATTIVIPAGSTIGSITLTAVQDPTDEPDETVIVDITGVTNATESGTQQVTTTILDDDTPAPTVTLSVDNATIAEAAGVATVTATLSAPSSSDVTINLAYTGTASGTDYNTSGASILITAGNTIGSVTITAVDDPLDEADETVIVDVGSVVNGIELGTQQVTTTILDDDATPTVTLGINNANIPETGGTATVTAMLSAPSGQNVTVNLAFSGVAMNGTDYSATGASILIPAGSTTGSITLNSIPDTDNEGNEAIFVDIDSVTNATELGVQQVTTTIVDDDFGTALVVTLTNSNNDIVVSQSGGNLFVKRGSTNLITPTPIASVSSLHIEGGSAVDKVTLHASLLGTFVGQFSFDGNNGNDSLKAQAIVGAGSFPTQFNGGAGNDAATGGDGNDTFIGGAGIDTLNGNAGNDSLDGGDDRDSLNGGDGNDVIHGGASGTATQIDTINGGNGDDVLYGDDGRDSILGGAGNDTILGGLGNDTVDGGAGNDGICGDEGDDSLKGGASNDTILGEAGNDKLFGDAGADLLHGGDDNDTLTGGSDTDSDTLFGAAGTNNVTLKVNDIETAFIFDCDDFFI